MNFSPEVVETYVSLPGTAMYFARVGPMFAYIELDTRAFSPPLDPLDSRLQGSESALESLLLDGNGLSKACSGTRVGRLVVCGWFS